MPRIVVSLEELRGRAGHTVPTRTVNSFVVPVQTRRVRLIGLFFDTDKAFLLPTAMLGLRRIRAEYDQHPRSNLLVVGHTDTSGTLDHNLDLSLERADSVAAFLTDDVDAWLKFFSADPKRVSLQWGTSEIQLMLSALPGNRKKFFVGPKTGREDDNTTQAIKAFQKQQALPVDGKANPATRRALIKAYMSLDGTTLPRRNPKTGEGIQVTTHGCGETFPTAIAEPAVAPASAPAVDGQNKSEDRRVELFFFGKVIQPAPPADKKSRAGSTEYPAWRKQVQSTVDLTPTLGDSSTDIVLQDIPGPQGVPLAFTPWSLQDGEEIVEQGETDINGRVNLQTQVDSDTRLTLHYPGRQLEVQLSRFAPVETIRGRHARLAFLGYNTGPRDGTENARTIAALRDFQRDQELPETGRADDATNQKLVAIAKG